MSAAGRRPILTLALVVFVAPVAGCGGEAEDRADPAPPAAEAQDPAATVPSAPEARPDSGIAGESAAAAAAVVAEYYGAIATRDYRRAYLLWERGGEASGQTFADFAAGYAETAVVAADVGPPGRVEGAAGSRYVEVPVTIRARTTAGDAQCFRGSYVLRHSVVPGASPEQREWRITSARVESVVAADCVGAAAAPASGVADSVVALVERMGRELAAVSLQAEAAVVRDAIRSRYGGLVTPELLARWLAEPAEAPGRAVSSPWPDRIDVQTVEQVADDRYRVTAEVVEVTSVEVASGGAAARHPVDILVQRLDDGTLRIAGYSSS